MGSKISTIMADTISDMFIRIVNAYKAGHESVIIPHSSLKNEILRVLKDGGFVKDIEKKGKKIRKFLEAELKYEAGEGALSGFQRISKPSRRFYAGIKDIKKIAKKGRGILIISTPEGVMTAKDAEKAGVGGEVIVRVW